MSQQYPFQCNIAQALNIIGDKWSLLILHGIMSCLLYTSDAADE